MPSDTWTTPPDFAALEVPTAAKLNQMRDDLYALWLAITTGSASIAERLSSGVYPPTLTNTTNIAASTAYECQWMRIDSVITVSGKFDVDPTTAATVCVLGLSLPGASNMGAAA